MDSLLVYHPLKTCFFHHHHHLYLAASYILQHKIFIWAPQFLSRTIHSYNFLDINSEFKNQSNYTLKHQQSRLKFPYSYAQSILGVGGFPIWLHTKYLHTATLNHSLGVGGFPSWLHKKHLYTATLNHGLSAGGIPSWLHKKHLHTATLNHGSGVGGIASGLHTKHSDFRRLNYRTFSVKSSGSESPPYKVLGVSPYATPDEIKRAYLKLARTYHPDVNKQANAHERFIMIKKAYDVLLKSDQYQGRYHERGSGASQHSYSNADRSSKVRSEYGSRHSYSQAEEDEDLPVYIKAFIILHLIVTVAKFIRSFFMWLVSD